MQVLLELQEGMSVVQVQFIQNGEVQDVQKQKKLYMMDMLHCLSIKTLVVEPISCVYLIWAHFILTKPYQP